MITCKKKATEETKKNPSNDTATSSGRGDTWTDTRTPFYDRDGNEIGRIRNPNDAYANEKGR